MGATLISQAIELFVTRRFPALTEFLPNIESMLFERKIQQVLMEI